MKSRPLLPTPQALLTTAFALALFTVGCGDRNTFVPPPPPEVEVMAPVIGDVTVYAEFPGRTESVSSAEIRARVRGFLKAALFEPGNVVKAGDPLFEIEPEEFQAAVVAADGRLRSAEAQQGIADTNLARRSQAAASGAVSAIDVESARAEAKAAAAAVDVARAAVDDAKRALSYTTVTSPIDGRVSDKRVDVGNLVGADGATLLTTVVTDDPIFVAFEGNERDLLNFLQSRSRENQTGFTESLKDREVRLTLSDGRVFPATGRLDFIDNQVNPTTGTIRVRARFDNPDSNLAVGLFVRLGVPETLQNVITIPSTAVQRDLGGDFVIVVGEDNIAQRRPVELTRFRVDGNSVITSGLTAEDRVVVSNLQRARPGLPVNPVATRDRPVPAGEAEAKTEPKAEPKSEPAKAEPEA